MEPNIIIKTKKPWPIGQKRQNGSYQSQHSRLASMDNEIYLLYK